jgi:hypothetical protein
LPEQIQTQQQSSYSLFARYPRLLTVVLFFIALLSNNIPLINIPFLWLATFFHEISHGLASILTGGQIVQIKLFLNGSGLCTTRGGWPVIISFAGYSGAVLWGLIIFHVSQYHNKLSQLFTLGLALLIVLLYVRDLLTAFICFTLLVIFILSWKYYHLKYLPVSLKFIAILVLLNSLQSPLYLLDGQSIGDGAALARLTLLPEIVWVLVWSIIGLSSFYLLWKKS